MSTRRVRRRKTPETDVGARIRAYAATYAGSGQKERAEGMLQAADMVDGELVKMTGKASMRDEGSVPVNNAFRWQWDGRDFDKLERRVAKLERLMEPRIVTSNGFDESSVKEVIRHVAPNGAELAKGAANILSAIRLYARTIDELIAMVGLKETSVRKYVGDLVAAGYATLTDGVCAATSDGAARAAELPAWNCEGSTLREWWMNRLSTGEKAILGQLADLQLELVGGGETRRRPMTVPHLLSRITTLKETSVRKYLGDLRRRRLVVRCKDGYELAPILRDGAA